MSSLPLSSPLVSASSSSLNQGSLDVGGKSFPRHSSFHDFLQSLSQSPSTPTSLLDLISSESPQPQLLSNSNLISGLAPSDQDSLDLKKDQKDDASDESLLNPFLGLIQNQQDILSLPSSTLASSSSLSEPSSIDSSVTFKDASKPEVAPSISSSIPFSASSTIISPSQSINAESSQILSNPTPPLSFETHQALTESSVKLFTHMQANRLESTVVQATPAHMGPLQATLQHDAQSQQYQISISVVHADAYQMMKDQVHQLSSALDQLGFDTSKIDIHHDPSMHQFISNPVNAPTPSSSDFSFPSQSQNSQSQSQSAFHFQQQSSSSSSRLYQDESDPLSLNEATRSNQSSSNRNFDRYA